MGARVRPSLKLLSEKTNQRASPTSRSGPQPVRAHFNPRASSKRLMRTTGATRLRISSLLHWRLLYARSWPTERNGQEAHLSCCRSAPTGLAGPRAARALAGLLRRTQTFLRTLGFEIIFGLEGQLGTRTIRMMAVNRCENTVSTVSRVSDNGHGAGLNYPRPGLRLGALIAQTLLTVLTQNSRPEEIARHGASSILGLGMPALTGFQLPTFSGF
jgi:hypothetical protein